MGVLSETDLLRNLVAILDESGICVIIRIFKERRKSVVARIVDECNDANSLLKCQGELICIDRFIKYFENREKRLKMLESMNVPGNKR